MGGNQNVGDEARRLLLRVAERTRSYDFSVWFWGDAIAVDGLLDAAELAADEDAWTHAVRYLLRNGGRQPTFVDYLTPGAALLRAARRAGRDDMAEAGMRLGRFIDSEVPRVGDLHLFRPELPAFRHAIWVDSLYHVPTFLAELATTTGEQSFAAAAHHFIVTHVKALRTPKGPLLAHSFDTGSKLHKGYGWGRGQGWALLGLVDTLEVLPDGAQRREIACLFSDLAAAMLPLQDESGFWRTLAYDPEAYLESSTAAMIGAAFAKGRRLGLLGEPFDAAADLAWSATQSRIAPDGSYRGVSAVTWSWTSNLEETTMYKSLPTETNVWGQGAALRFAGERMRSGRHTAQ